MPPIAAALFTATLVIALIRRRRARAAHVSVTADVTSRAVARLGALFPDAPPPPAPSPPCIICLEDLDTDRVRTLHCRHTFHAACLDEWVSAATAAHVSGDGGSGDESGGGGGGGGGDGSQRPWIWHAPPGCPACRSRLPVVEADDVMDLAKRAIDCGGGENWAMALLVTHAVPTLNDSSFGGGRGGLMERWQAEDDARAAAVEAREAAVAAAEQDSDLF